MGLATRLDLSLECSVQVVMVLEPVDLRWAAQSAVALLLVTVERLQSMFDSLTDFVAALILAVGYVIWIVADPIPTIDLFLV